MNRLIILSVIFFSCSSSSGGSGQAGDTTKANSIKKGALSVQSNPLAFRSCVSFDVNVTEQSDSAFRMALMAAFPEDFNGVRPSQIVGIKERTKDFPIMGTKHWDVYEITLASDLPEVISSVQYVVVNREKGWAAIFPLSTLSAFEISGTDTTALIGGVFLVKGKGYYMVYRYKNIGTEGFKLIFDSSKDPGCQGSLAVYNSSLDCISYKPFQLKLDILDVDKDGWKDLVFSGNVLFFCKGLETGYGRKDRTPIREEQVKIVFRASMTNDSPTWVLQDTSVCSLLAGE